MCNKIRLRVLGQQGERMTYEEICEMNRYLYEEAELLFLMYSYLRERPRGSGLTTKYAANLKKVRAQIDRNLEELEILWTNQAKRDQLHEKEKHIKL